MNPARSEPLDYINFLVAAQKSFTCSEAARCQPDAPGAPAHDAFTRLLQTASRARGGRPRGWYNACWCWTTPPWTSPTQEDGTGYPPLGKHRRVVAGINLLDPVVDFDGHALNPAISAL